MKKFSICFFHSCIKATEYLERKQTLGLSFMEELQLRFHLLMCKIGTAFWRPSKTIDALTKKEEFESD